MSKVYSLKKVEFLPIKIGEVWEFFSSPANLREITPPGLGFNFISEHSGDQMYAG